MVPEWAEGTFAVVAVLVTVHAYLNGASRPTAEDRERGRRTGAVLMLAGVALGSTAGGTIFAERSADDPAPAVAWLVFAAAGLALTSGVALRAGARERREAEPQAARGRALVHSLREGGPGVHGIPVWELDLEVTAPGIAPFRTDLLAEIPPRMVGTLEEGRYVPVLVEGDPVKKVTLDWVRTPEGAARERYEAPVAVTAPGPPLAARTATSPLGRLVKIVLPFAIVAFAASLSSRLFESQGDGSAPVPAPTMTDLAGPVSSPPGVEPAFKFTAPQGWSALTEPERSPLPRVTGDVILVPADGAASVAVVGRVRGVDASDRSLVDLLPVLVRRLDATVVPSTIQTLDGVDAVALDLLGPGAEAPGAAVVHGGRVVVVAALGVPGEGQSLGSVVEGIVESWSWR